jgi:hypothetical protein
MPDGGAGSYGESGNMSDNYSGASNAGESAAGEAAAAAAASEAAAAAASEAASEAAQSGAESEYSQAAIQGYRGPDAGAGSYGHSGNVDAGASRSPSGAQAFGPSGVMSTDIAVNTPANPEDPNYGVTDPYGSGVVDTRSFSEKVSGMLQDIDWGKVGKYMSYIGTIAGFALPAAGVISQAPNALSYIGKMTELANKYGGVAPSPGSQLGQVADAGNESFSPNANYNATGASRPTHTLSAVNLRSVLPGLNGFMKRPGQQEDGLFKLS